MKQRRLENGGKIVPFRKTDPRRISEDASLDEYEKMAEKFASSSDAIIDEALDRLEGRAPLGEKPLLPTPTVDPAAEARATELEAKVKELEGKLAEAEGTVKGLTDKVAALEAAKSAAAKPPMALPPVPFEDEMKRLTDKNDDLILKNSELEFEISRLRTENNALKSRLEGVANDRRLPPQASSREGYTRFRGNPTQCPPRRGMNGYESWN